GARAPPALPSFPTRRSSDLARPLGGRLPRAARLRGGADGPGDCARGDRACDAPVREAPAHLVPARAWDRVVPPGARGGSDRGRGDRKSTRLNSSHVSSSYAV